MQDLVEGREYIATLYNDYYQGESVHVIYIGVSPYTQGCIEVEVATTTEWPRVDDDSGVWLRGETVTLSPDNYTFEEYNVSLENK